MKDNNKSKFSIRLKELRKQNNLTQFQLAKSLFFDQSTISDWEMRGKEPNYDTLIKLVKILNTTADYLLGISDDNY